MMSHSDELFAAVRSKNHAAVRAIVESDRDVVNARDADGATPLHYAAELGDRASVETLLDAGGEINARDSVFGATPAGWAIEYLRERGALLGLEIEDVRHAIARGDREWAERLVTRLPALRDAVDRDGVPLREHAARSGDGDMSRLLGSRLL